MTRRRHQNRNSTTPRSQPPPPKPQHQQRQDSTLFGSSNSIKSCRLLPRNPTLPYKTTNGCIIPNKTFYWQPTWPCCDWIPPRRRRLGGNPIGTVCHPPQNCSNYCPVIGRYRNWINGWVGLPFGLMWTLKK